ncbi:MAG: succinylglutamate desuccinylase/aspartoacylase family protein, partial [Pseudomonadota bacterium]
MSFEQHCIRLDGDSPGQFTELNYYRIGPESASRKVYLQAAIHADEQPGILVLHHLLSLLRSADEAGLLQAVFVVFPMVNPLGMANIEFLQHQGRYNPGTGVNFNRQWPDLSAAIDERVCSRLGDDAERNKILVRTALRDWVEQMSTVTAVDQWRKALYREACDADYVFDLHCDDDSLLHIFSVPQMAQEITSLANWTGAVATMLAEDSGGGSFDEVWPAIWLQLARENPDKSIPLPVLSCTLEYRGQMDTYDHINQDDAARLYAYFQ